MKVDTEKIEKLLESETQYRISKETEISQSTISRLQSGERKIENLTIAVGAKLTAYAEKLEKIAKSS
ncbi:DNA-binding protein [Streptococcus cuniculi]|uniref:DNA-binding protein n=1 Tax=Streptococcus cuniculi TaxID=1432788 RepID=A0A1Q8E693_9STRE|nr:DNA-binding protein [Streptococcus cuniculi]OLF47317.1 DNA-binding protein [Streptococcus cuniculi]QBX23171.1 hypothetical protein Javan116_0042 [Streptococcus phage Javan116]